MCQCCPATPLIMCCMTLDGGCSAHDDACHNCVASSQAPLRTETSVFTHLGLGCGPSAEPRMHVVAHSGSSACQVCSCIYALSKQKRDISLPAANLKHGEAAHLR